MGKPVHDGWVVAGNAFCNRDAERADLLRAIRSNDKLFVFSERRFGKTSLVQSVISRLPKKDALAAYVDLWPTDDESSFVGVLARGIALSMSTSTQKLLHKTGSLFSSLEPSLTVNGEGNPDMCYGCNKQ